jgi:hypothetical protein
LLRVNPSRAVYSGFAPIPFAKLHLIVAEGDGALAVIGLFSMTEAAFAERATLIYVANSSSEQVLACRLQELRPNTFRLLSDIPTLLWEVERLLEHSTMGTGIYVSGTECFIGRVVQLAAHQGIGFSSLRTERRGPLSRRVQCVHCKNIMEEVSADLVNCTQCRITLFVRDHYSPRISAFMGVAADVSLPSLRPPNMEPRP